MTKSLNEAFLRTYPHREAAHNCSSHPPQSELDAPSSFYNTLHSIDTVLFGMLCLSILLPL